MPLLIAILLDDTARMRLDRALDSSRSSSPPHDLRVVASWSAAREVAAKLPPQLAIFDPYTSGVFAVDECTAFRKDHPAVALLPYGDFARRPVRDVLSLARMGVDELVVRNEDDSLCAFRERIDRALRYAFPGQVLRELEDLIPPTLTPFLHQLVAVAERSACPREAARLYHRHPNTLREHLRRARLPPVNKLIVWARLFHAAHLLGSSRRSVDSVALVLSFPSATAMRNQIQRYTGITPQQIRSRGGLPCVIAAFRERFRDGGWETTCGRRDADLHAG